MRKGTAVRQLAAHKKVTGRRPAWLKVRLGGGPDVHAVRALVKEQGLHTVCESARCPNIGDCWARRTATFMLLGDVCTRACAFCAVKHGLPAPVDANEPERVAQAVQVLRLEYAVVTSVTRDDLPDGGASHFAATFEAIRAVCPQCKVEVLIPDFAGSEQALDIVVRARPDDGPPFIGMTYGPLLVNIGFNAEGIGVAIDSVYPTDGRVGVPRILCARAVLNAHTIGEAIRACVPKLRAGGYSYLLADSNGELYCVETSATTHDITYGEEGWLVHTNHYLSPKMQLLEQPGTYAASHVSLDRARRLLRQRLGQVTVEDLQTVLRDHVNFPNSICLHPDPAEPPAERDQTLVSLVMDLSARVMWAAPGPPCENEYTPYAL